MQKTINNIEHIELQQQQNEIIGEVLLNNNYTINKFFKN